MKKVIYTVILAAVALLAAIGLSGCGSAADAANEQLNFADEAMAEGRYQEAQEVLDALVADGFKGLSEQNLGRMSVQLMHLSELSHNDENIAVATECYRAALALSADSLHTFSSTLSPDELANFYLVRRIASGIDNPVDLTAEEFTEEDQVAYDTLTVH